MQQSKNYFHRYSCSNIITVEYGNNNIYPWDIKAFILYVRNLKMHLIAQTRKTPELNLGHTTSFKSIFVFLGFPTVAINFNSKHFSLCDNKCFFHAREKSAYF